MSFMDAMHATEMAFPACIKKPFCNSWCADLCNMKVSVNKITKSQFPREFEHIQTIPYDNEKI